MRHRITKVKLGEIGNPTNVDKVDTKVCFDKKKDTKSICVSLVNTYFGQAERLKMGKRDMVELLEISSYVSLVNLSVYIHEIYKRSLKEGITPDEILGEFQLSLQGAWNLLSSHPMGRKCFNRMDIKDIIEIDEPAELLSKSGTTY
jgi:hypothetical protein